jgi:hypothetical protein
MRRIWLVVIGVVVVLFVVTIAMQAAGLAPAARITD